MCSKPIFCSKIALKGKTCSRLLKPQKVAPNAKSCSKVAEHNRDRPTRDCQGKKRVKCRITYRPPPGEGREAKLYHDFTELHRANHEATKIVIFEAETAMHHATSAQVEFEELKPFPCGISEQAFGSRFADGLNRGFCDTSGCNAGYAEDILYLTQESGDCLKSFSFACQCQNHHESFLFSGQRRIWSFHVVALQRTAKKCTNNYNARAEPLFCSLNLRLPTISLPSLTPY